MTILSQLRAAASDGLRTLFPEADAAAFTPASITLTETKPEFEGDYTVVLFPFLKTLRQKPDALGAALGAWLTEHTRLVSAHRTVGGFLNLSIRDDYWKGWLLNTLTDTRYGEGPKGTTRTMVEYSSPNTNKPLHFGHLRNIFLGAAVVEILRARGEQVVAANLVNDRGIHICKSMVAWQRYAGGATPQSTGTKGDHLVGDYYVRYNEAVRAEVASLVSRGMSAEEAEREAPIFKEAQSTLRQWEAGEPAVRALWTEMNSWVYAGFEESYKRLGVGFDVWYYESDTYLLGKALVEAGLEGGRLYKKEDGSVWCDLQEHGLDDKLLLRSDGTSVYMTQDLGTAVKKWNDYSLDRSLYVIGDEQNHHMRVLALVLQKLGEPVAAGVHHLSYGMVELPTGKMKSREGTVVDADEMMAEMAALAKAQTEAAGKTEGFSAGELETLYETIGLGALKFYLLRVDPKKKMVFDPAESIDLHGYTATFIQYAHARIHSILRKAGVSPHPDPTTFQSFALTEGLHPEEKELLVRLERYPEILREAAADLDPSKLCQYLFTLAQAFNTFYSVHPVATAESEEKRALRLMVCILTASVIRHGMNLLGIRVPEKM